MKQLASKNKKILITGGAGFIGFHLAKLLSKNPEYQVTICDNFFRSEKDKHLRELLKRKNIRLIEMDLSDRNDFGKLGSNYDYVYHLAAINGTKYFYEIPHKVLRNNILSEINILDWFVKSNSKKILFTSSSETYAATIQKQGGPIPTPETVLLSIDDVMNPRWSYAGSKIIGELLFVNYARAYKFEMVIIRYHNVYGPRMGYAHVIPEFIKRIYETEDPFNIYGGQETRTFSYVDDAVKMTQELMESDKTNGKIINVGSGQSEEIKIRGLAEKLFKIAKYEPKIKVNPAPKGSVLRRCPDLTLLKKMIAYKPKVKLEEGLLRTYQWYLKELSHSKKA